MKKRLFKILSLCLVVVMTLTLSACGKDVQVDDISSDAPVTSTPPTEIINPLTGLRVLDPQKADRRPVAIMINNMKPNAQRVQTGLDKADIVYEAYAEGGVTRLLAVFKDIESASTIGTVRSARYSFIDLALGHDAIYVHAGINESHATPHVKETGIDNINLLHGKYNGMSFREPNGEALEHTLYTTGEKLWNGFNKLNWRTELKRNKENWQSFAPEGTEITPTTGKCQEVSVKMSSSYVSRFEYDLSTKTYKKFNGTSAHKDYRSGKQIAFKNVLVLKTTVTSMDSKGYLQKTGLTGGDGYYFSNGSYVNIKWSKGSATNPIKITLEDGSACTYNAGNTWVCLVNMKNSVTITAPEEPSSTVAAN